MNRWATALAALVLGAFAPIAAHAADSYTSDQLDKGKKDAPAIVQKSGAPCTITSAAYIGASSDKDGKSDVYEVACQQGLGYILMSSAKGVKAYDCLATADQKTLACKLPANANPTAGLASVVAAAKVTCTPTKARYVGSNATTTVYEVACQEGAGYILQTPAIGAPAAATVALPCLETEKGSMACTLTTKAQDEAVVQALVAKSGKTCQVSGDRFIGTDSKTGDGYLEVGCGTQPGFILATTSAGAFGRVIPCTEAQGLGGGCTLTDMSVINAQAMTSYSQAVKAAGFDCNVDKFRVIGADSAKSQIVELACSNRPDGVVASIPASPTGKVRLNDCVTAAVYGEAGACTLTSKSAIYARYNTALTAKGRGQCVVNDARYIGDLGNGDSFVETACTDGKPGWVVDFTRAGVAKDVLSCGQAKAAGIGCQMAANLKG